MVTSFPVWLLVAVTAVAAQPRCSMGVGFDGPSADRAIVLAVATAEMVQVPVPDRALISGTVPDTLGMVTAYRFRVVQAAGGGGELGSLETFLAVPWDYDAGCDLLPWGSEDWVSAGDEAVFTLTEPRTEHAGEPVFDLLGGHSPYPQGELLKYESREDREAWLSAREYFAMLAALPEAAGESPAEYVARLERAFAEGDPRWRATFPGTEILRRARSYARRRSVPRP